MCSVPQLIKEIATMLLAYTVKETKGQTFWTKVGVAFPHKDGKGFNVMLDAVPVDGKLTIREYVPKPQDTSSVATPDAPDADAPF
jgi:hypothetical protein